MQYIQLKWKAWFGDKPLTLNFPSSWNVDIEGKTNLPAITSEAMTKKLRNPIGTPPLSVIAKAKKRATIVIDDMTRPTPAADILPLLIEELRRAGMRSRAITIVIGSGGHPPIAEEDIFQKVGLKLVEKIKIIPHDCNRGLKFLGQSSGGVPLYVNRTVMNSDLKIGVTSILPHPIASFSGGSKIIAPGVCGLETIRYLHDYMNHSLINYYRNSENRAELGINRFRREIERITAIIGLDFSVNVLLNHSRKICALFAGNSIDCYYNGTLLAKKIYAVNFSKDADVIIANTYPFDTSIHFMLRGIWPLIGTGCRTIKVVVGAGNYGVGDVKMVNPLGFIGSRLLNRVKILRPNLLHHDFRVGLNALKNIVAQKRVNFLFLSPGIRDDVFRATFPNSKRYNKWEELLRDLEHLLAKRESVKVAVYPCAPLQIPVERSI